jgi:hypothetical protein
VITKQRLQEIYLFAFAALSYFLAMSLYVDTLSAFLNEFGARFLPFILISRAVFVTFYSLFSTAFSARFSFRKCFLGLLLLFALILGFLPFSGFLGSYQIILFFFSANALFLALDVSLLGIVNTFMNPVQAKNFIPKIYAVSDLALILGSFSGVYLKYLDGDFGQSVVPFVLICCSIFLLLQAHRSQTKTNGATAPKPLLEKKPNVHPLQECVKAFHYVIFESRLFRTIMLCIFLMVGLQLFIEYKLDFTLSEDFLENDLSFLLGTIFFLENSLRFIWNLFFSKRILFGAGAINAIMLYPAILLVILMVGFVFNFNYVFAILIYLSSSIYYFSTVQAANSQIISATPKKKAEATYYVLAEWTVGLSAMFFASFLLIYLWFPQLEKSLNTFLIGLLALLLIWKMLKLKKYYLEDLKSHLNDGGPEDKLNAIDLLTERIQKNKGEFLLLKLLETEKDNDTRKKIIHNLALIGNPESVFHLINVIEKDIVKNKFAAVQAIEIILKKNNSIRSFPLTKHLILESYEKMFIADVPLFLKIEILHSLQHFNIDEVIGFLQRNLMEKDPQIVANTIEIFSKFDDRSIIYYLKPFLRNSDYHIYCAALVALWKYQEVRIDLLDILVKILKSDDKEMIEAGLFIINAANIYWEKGYVLEKLKHPDEKIRIYALTTMINLGNLQYVDQLLENMLDFYLHSSASSMEFVLSRFRRFTPKTKKFIIFKILRLSFDKANIFLEIFKNSQYIFDTELEAFK